MHRLSAEDSKKHCEHTKKLRSDEKFNLFGKDVEHEAAIFDEDPPRLPRKKRVPVRIEECLRGGAALEFDDDVASHYRKI